MAPNQQRNRKSVVITGATSGLGFGCAKALLRSNPSWHVVLASHSEQRTAEAASQLQSETGSTLATTLELDLASLESVRTFVRQLGQHLDAGNVPPLHAVVCNAATQQVSGTVYTDDGFEATFGVNHLGHFLLVNLLLSRIQSPGRVLFIAGSGSEGPEGFWDRALSMAPPRTDFENLREIAVPEDDTDADPAWIGTQRYATSKLANVLTAYELDHRLSSASLSTAAAPITSNVFGPGLMPGTGLARDYSPVQRFLWNAVLPALRVLPSVRSPAESGRDLARLVTDPELENTSGEYFDGREITRSHPASYDEEMRRTLWEESAEFVELSENSSSLQPKERE
jgi:NAD(P)-dependent dehydrogenase (short-subunit alcohol dehydrogenase family)